MSSSDSHLFRADEIFHEIFFRFGLFDHINPLNQDRERERFFEALDDRQTYEPVFELKSLPRSVAKAKESLEALTFGAAPLDLCYAAVRDEQIRILDLLEARGTDRFTALSTELFGSPADALVYEARKTLRSGRKDRSQEAQDIGVKGLMERFRERLREDRIEGWDVLEDPNAVPLSFLDYGRHKIHLKTGVILANSLVERLLCHEIEVHVYRAMNGERQPYKVFGLGLDRHMQAEEGLALELEEREGHQTPGVRQRYAGRVLASALTATHTFSQCYKELAPFFSREDTFTLVERSKRGMRDTSRPGGFVHDHIFLQGQRDLRGLPAADLKLLFVGKIGLHHLPLVRELLAAGRLMEPAFLPNAFAG